MNLNRTVNILGTSIQVMTVPMADECGESDADQRVIKIDTQVPLDTQLETFYHEVTHIILALSGVGVVLTAQQEEAVAQALGHGFYRFLCDNEGLPVSEDA